MQALLKFSALTFLLLAASSPCSAMVSLADVSKERAKAMGVTLRSKPNGDAGVAVWLEFKTQGELKNFAHVEVRVMTGGKTMSHAYLMPSRPTPDSVSAYFSADPAWLATSVLTIVVKNGERDLVGYQFKVKDFVEVEKVR